MKIIFNLKEGSFLMTYKTKQKEDLLEAIKRQNRPFLVKDLYTSLQGSIGLTTIYRMIDKLVGDGVVAKTIGNGHLTYYQYLEKCDEEDHFYLQCSECGKLIHVDCSCIGDLTKHIYDEHHFISNKKQIIFLGLCENCQKKGVVS